MRWCGRDLRRLDHLRCPVKKNFHAVGRLRRLAREQDHKSPFVFAGRRSMPQHVWMRLEAEFRRFACDTGALHAYLGHKNIQRTVHYTKLSPDRFKDFWR